ncbi:MAG: HAMP domain-containing histidine kinase [Lachnospiraceae bacterium]|nr:HAMP domain-containing histidine kinase [Lachnospiraceae bacterium]
MRRLENFIKIVVLTIIMLVVMLVADLLVMTYFGLKTDSGMTKFSTTYLSREVTKTVNEQGETQYSMSQQGIDRIDAFHGFAFLLDDAGDVVWSYQLPDDVPEHYTIRDIVRFTRYYLNDYPVYTHILDDVVLVAGMPRQTVWKYHFSFQISTVNMFAYVLPVLLLLNIIVLLVGPFLIIKHDEHRRERQRTSWIAGVSHDIRTPLSLVLGYADELLHSAQSNMEWIEKKSVAEKAQMIEQQAIRIKTLVTNLNTSNKLTYGMGVWHQEKVLLPALIRESICEIVNRGLDEKYDISVTIMETLEEFYVKGDRELIKRLIENLINNAISHNPQGCEISVSLTSQSRWICKRIQLEVSDNGCGVSKEQLKNFRASIKLDKLPEHGLGIRLVWQIASFHHWRVRFTRSNAGGFCCRIYVKPLIRNC